MKRHVVTTAVIAMLIGVATAQSNKHKSNHEQSSSNTVAAATSPVTGSGSPGRISKWAGVFGSNTFALGDSNIFEDKFGKVGINTANPTSPLTVQGLIETTLGGYKFPDGTIQTTAALGGLQFVAHDSTLRGEGTSASPLGVAIPLLLTGDAGNEVLLGVRNIGDAGTGLAVSGGDSSTGGAGTGVFAQGGSGFGFVGGSGVRAEGGFSDSQTGGDGAEGFGGNSDTGTGGVGVRGFGGRSNSQSGGAGITAVGGQGSGAGNFGGLGVFATGGPGASGAGNGFAGLFQGDVQVTGNLQKGGGSFKIDHPLDPENNYLYHSFVESPDMKNIYDGTVTTDQEGDATINLPDYFEALNRDFRYQLTVVGTFAQAIVASEIESNHFRIKTSAPNVKVSWQVTGIRQDAYANKHRIQVVEAKPESERGTYLHPDAFNQPEGKNVLFIQHPRLMQRINEPRDKAQKGREN